MQDEIEAELRRRFAECVQPLAAEPFVTRLAAALPARRPAESAVRRVVHDTHSALRSGLRSVLRVRHAGGMLAAAAIVAAWAALG
jgi:hypothetical protein